MQGKKGLEYFVILFFFLRRGKQLTKYEIGNKEDFLMMICFRILLIVIELGFIVQVLFLKKKLSRYHVQKRQETWMPNCSICAL